MVRSLERRIERLLEGVAGKVFSGRLHPSEIAGKLAREADLARFEQETGPATANVYTIVVNPRDLSLDPGELEHTLGEAVDRYTIEEGLRLEGPVRVNIESSPDVAAGSVGCHVEVEPGRPVPWSRLTSNENTVEIGHNRALIGRQADVDVVLPHDDISRRHALIWRQGGHSWIKDLGSSNGTTLDGTSVTDESLRVQTGSVIAFAGNRYRFLEI